MCRGGGGEGGLPGGQWQCSGGQAEGEEGGMDLCRGHKLEQRVGHIFQNDTGFMLDIEKSLCLSYLQIASSSEICLCVHSYFILFLRISSKWLHFDFHL